MDGWEIYSYQTPDSTGEPYVETLCLLYKSKITSIKLLQKWFVEK